MLDLIYSCNRRAPRAQEARLPDKSLMGKTSISVEIHCVKYEMNMSGCRRASTHPPMWYTLDEVLKQHTVCVRLVIGS